MNEEIAKSVKKFHDVDDSNNNINDDSNDDNNNNAFDVGKLHGDAAGLDDVANDYHDHHDDDSDYRYDGFVTRKLHRNATELDDVGDDYCGHDHQYEANKLLMMLQDLMLLMIMIRNLML